MFISYAQNFEDIMLWRALKHIEKGFYIDIGAWSPDLDSVTRAFYERGWNGVNIEPNPNFHAQLEKHRLRDFNLQVAIGDHKGTIRINLVEESGLSTADAAFAAEHRQSGMKLREKEVPLLTLSSLCEKYVFAKQEIHFLKVDVEGMEKAVLVGNDWTRYRPWIVVAEATLPLSKTESYDTWEPILLAADYCFAYADGLNRFYVSKEQSNLLASFLYPPNVFDKFMLNETKQAIIQADQAIIRAKQAEGNSNALLNSLSWRVTTPLRWLASLLPKTLALPGYVIVRLRLITSYLIACYKLSSHERNVYVDLKKAIKSHQKEIDQCR